MEPALEQAAEHFERRARPTWSKHRAPGATPSGVGLDVPAWILRLEQELHRVETAKSALVSLAETLLQVPRVEVPFEGVLEQFENWEKWRRIEVRSPLAA